MMKILLGFFRSILRIALLTALLVAVVLYANLSPEEKNNLLHRANEKTPFDIVQLRDKVQNFVRNEVVKSDIPIVKDSVANLSNLLNTGEGHFQILDINCGMPETKSSTEVENTKIYQWRDNEGNVHFGDAKLKNTVDPSQIEDISQKYASKQQYFDLQITPINSRLPLFFRDKISANVSKIFGVLSDTLSYDILRQIKLNLKLFGNQGDFESYVKENAGGIQNVAGLYLPLKNEAAIWHRGNEHYTLGIIRHESTHAIMASLYGLTPIWLNEGLAEYFETLSVKGLSATVSPNPNILTQLKQLRAKGLVSAKQQMSLPATAWQGENINDNYALAWGLVYFLMTTDDGKRAIARYFSALAEDKCLIPDSTESFDKNYPGGIQQLNQDWLNWIDQNLITTHRF